MSLDPRRVILSLWLSTIVAMFFAAVMSDWLHGER